MLKLLKWELIKRFQEFKIYYLIFLGISIVCLVMPANIKNYSGFVAITSSLYGGIFSVMLSIYLMIATTFDLRRPTAIMEKSICKKPWEILGARLLSNMTFLLITFGTVKTLSWILKKFATQNTSFLNVEITFETISMMGVVLPLIILFIYLFIKSIPFTKERPIFSTIIALIIISLVFSRFISNESYSVITLGGNIILIILSIPFSIFLFIGSCFLYERNYEL